MQAFFKELLKKPAFFLKILFASPILKMNDYFNIKNKMDTDRYEIKGFWGS